MVCFYVYWPCVGWRKEKGVSGHGTCVYGRLNRILVTDTNWVTVRKVPHEVLSLFSRKKGFILIEIGKINEKVHPF